MGKPGCAPLGILECRPEEPATFLPGWSRGRWGNIRWSRPIFCEGCRKRFDGRAGLHSRNWLVGAGEVSAGIAIRSLSACDQLIGILRLRMSLRFAHRHALLRVCDFFEVAKNRCCKQNSDDDKILENAKTSQTLRVTEHSWWVSGVASGPLCLMTLIGGLRPGFPSLSRLCRVRIDRPAPRRRA